ncbi:epididymal secretory protein E1 precursor-like protein [Leptotrombidium deliense]|uniref:Epididymal secretory protein E1-like protein n=1 Tax=Leptotrombidium deliense TaxID=299467 RepID=A0A443RV08_9ACAR|nr:epididymal secretory protein E1 precursor-like protein [Leptotrombidium deliense]
MKFLILCVLAFCGIVFAKLVSKTDCGKREVQSFDIEPCTTEPCKLKAGQNVKFTLVFISIVLDGSASIRVPKYHFIMTLMNFPPTSLCDSISCSIVPDNTYTATYTITLPNKKEHHVLIKMTIKGDNGNTGCIKFVISLQ